MTALAGPRRRRLQISTLRLSYDRHSIDEPAVETVRWPVNDLVLGCLYVSMYYLGACFEPPKEIVAAGNEHIPRLLCIFH